MYLPSTDYKSLYLNSNYLPQFSVYKVLKKVCNYFFVIKYSVCVCVCVCVCGKEVFTGPQA